MPGRCDGRGLEIRRCLKGVVFEKGRYLIGVALRGGVLGGRGLYRTWAGRGGTLTGRSLGRGRRSRASSGWGGASEPLLLARLHPPPPACG